MLQRLRRIVCFRLALLAIILAVVFPAALLPALAGGDAQAWNARGLEYLKLNKITEAIDAFKKSIALNPNSDAPHGNLGLIYFQFKAYDDALVEYQTASRLKPGNGNYHFKIGQLYFEKKNYSKAIQAFEKTLSIKSDNDEAIYYLGQVYLSTNKLQAALDKFNQAFKLRPGEMKYQLAIGEIHLRMGKISEAQEEFSRVRDNPSSSPELKKKAAQKIESAGKAVREKKLKSILNLVMILIGLAILAGIILILLRRRQIQLELSALARAKMDTDNLNGVANYALQQMLISTRMPRGAVFFAENEFTLLRPYASTGIPSQQLGSLEMVPAELPEWFQRIGGQPFAVVSEKMEALFNRVFPDSGAFLEEMEIKIGVPFISNNRLYGMAYIGCKKLSPRLARIFEKNLPLILQTMGEVAESIENIRMYLVSVTDELTQVYNKRYLWEALKNLAQKSSQTGSPFSLIMLDIDNFRKINDTYGRLQGDVVLKRLAARLKPILRENLDALSRIGGEEFAILLPSMDIERTSAMAEEIRRITAEMQLPHPIPSITISLGVAVFPAHARTFEDLVARADEALFVSKNSGKNKVTLSSGVGDGKSPAFIGENLREEEALPSTVKPWTIPSRDTVPTVQAGLPPKPPEGVYSEAMGPQQVPVQPPADISPQIIAPWSVPRSTGAESWGQMQPKAPEDDGSRTIPLASSSPWAPQQAPLAAPPGWGQPQAPQQAQPTAPPGWGQPQAPQQAQPAAPPGWGQPQAPQQAQPTAPPGWGQPQAPQQAQPTAPPGWGEPQAPQWEQPAAPQRTMPSTPQSWGLPGSGIPPPPPAPPVGTKATQKKPALQVGWGELREEQEKSGPSMPSWESPPPVRERTEQPEAQAAFIPSSIPAAPKLPLVSSPLATRDPVTGYYNREYFDYALGEELRKSYQEQKPCSIIFFSIDEIKKIRFDNPDAGKDLIAQVTEQIGFFLKEGVDIPTCYGEDEFAIILPRTSSAIAFNLAEQIRETVAILTYGPKAEHVSVSLGISSYPDRTTHPDELVQQARSAMERAQAEGRNKSVLYTPD